MKKLLSILLVLVAIFAFCACGSEEREIYQDGNAKATVVIYSDEAYTTYNVKISSLDNATVLGAMEYLHKEKDVALTYSTSEYGAYVTEFGPLKEDGANSKYVLFWTSVQSDWDVSAYATEREFEGTKLVSSGLGVSTAKLEDGAIIYFELVAF